MSDQTRAMYRQVIAIVAHNAMQRTIQLNAQYTLWKRNEVMRLRDRLYPNRSGQPLPGFLERYL